ncbi:ROK family protein [Amycolatopsis circi]|uniref:ROK family protein n=1 Tax=Amycolatopsis circi TaxID=871959 RepID=UPI0013BE9252|nr:ROK family protein [Amycolatopsis circi]
MNKLGVPAAAAYPQPSESAAARLLNLVHLTGSVSRAEATAQLALPRSTASEAVGELVELGLIAQGPPARQAGASRGRPSPQLYPDPAGPVVVAARLDSSEAELAVVGLGGAVGHRRRIPLTAKGKVPKRTFSALAGWMREAVAESGRPCAGAAVGLAGMVRATDGLVHSALHLDWKSVPAQEILAAELPEIPRVEVGKDALFAALAEHHRGAGRGARILLMLTCEHVGIGGAVLQQGIPFTGAGNAVEAGHIVVDPTGVPCSCGMRGCLEVSADGRALGDPAEVSDLLRRAAAGEPSAVARIGAAAANLGRALASLTNLFDPDRVVVSGLLGEYLRIAPDRIHAELTASVVARTQSPTVVAGSVASPVLIGAAERAFERLLAYPRLLAEAV